MYTLPRKLASRDFLPTLLRRFCELNENPAFASCSVSQELSNEQIDKENADSEVGTCLPHLAKAVWCELFACAISGAHTFLVLG